MKSGYVYFDESELLLIKNALQKNKDQASQSLSMKIEAYKNNYWADKNKSFSVYKTQAVDKLKSINAEMVENEEITLDDDALVATSKNGAYVHFWLWVENAVKPKRTRKKAV